MKTRIGELCRAVKIENPYQLQKACNFSPSQATRLYKDEVEAISLSVLKTLCNVLQCSPNDITGFDVAPVAPVADKPKQKSKPFVNPELLRMEKDGVFNNSVLDIVNSSSDNEYVLTTAAAGELLNLSPRTVRENAEKGLLPGKQGKQSHWFFRRSDIDNFIAQRG
jgi:DNA-binding Xre family transcriptional regulator